MRALIAASLFVSTLAGSSAFADTLTCTLQSGAKSESVALNLEDAAAAEEGQYGTDGVYDLNFHLLASCDRKNCEASITVDSAKLQDEAGQTGFEFTRGTDSAEVFREPITNAPDKRKYELVCTYQN